MAYVLVAFTVIRGILCVVLTTEMVVLQVSSKSGGVQGLQRDSVWQGTKVAERQSSTKRLTIMKFTKGIKKMKESMKGQNQELRGDHYLREIMTNEELNYHEVI